MAFDTSPSRDIFRPERGIVSHAVWLYLTFRLSFRDVQLMLAERGVVVSYETIRRWCRKCVRITA
jgi:putative transposase